MNDFTVTPFLNNASDIFCSIFMSCDCEKYSDNNISFFVYKL